MYSLEGEAAQLLRRHGYTASVRQLHTMLVREHGPMVGSYHELYDRLKRAHERFALVDRTDPLIPDPTWSGEARERYAEALRGAGVDFTPVVSLVPAESESEGFEEIQSVLRRTLIELYDQMEDRFMFQEDMVAALQEIARWATPVSEPAKLVNQPAAAPTTTPPPDPPPLP